MCDTYTTVSSPNPRRLPALPPHTRRPTPAPVAESPRLARLAADADVPGAVPAFWREVADAGAPLIEPADDPAYRIVTFLWRGTDPKSVVLIANKLTDFNDLTPNLLRRLANTDVWHVSYRMRADWRGTYGIAPLPEPLRQAEPWRGPDRAAWQDLRAHAVPDPLNPDTFPNKFGDEPLSLVELPEAPPQPWHRPDPAVPAGTVDSLPLRSEILGNERQISLYTPPGYQTDAEPYPVLVLLDGDVWAGSLPVAHTLDNLIAAGKIPPLVAVLVDSVNVPTRVVELACDTLFLRFLTDELLPWAGSRYRLSTDPRRTIIAGQSLGGLTAAFAASQRPDRFGNVLSQAGSFWWPSGSAFGTDAEWLTRHLAGRERLPIAFYLEVGLLEWELLGPTRHLRSVLTAHGYPLTYREYHGGHDAACWRGGIADGLCALTARWDESPPGPAPDSARQPTARQPGARQPGAQQPRAQQPRALPESAPPDTADTTRREPAAAPELE